MSMIWRSRREEALGLGFFVMCYFYSSYARKLAVRHSRVKRILRNLNPVPAKNSVQIEIVAFTEPQPVTFPGHADSTFLSARLFPSVAPFCKQRFLLSDISFWSCNVRTAVISSVSVGLIDSCGFGSRGCGTIGDRRCSLSNRRRLSPSIARDFASIGDGRVGVAKVARRYIRKFGISSRHMSLANPRWGAPRIHGELLKLGIQVSQATVAKYMSGTGNL